MKNERKRLILFWLSFCSLFGAWKIVGIKFPPKFASCVSVLNKHSFKRFCVWILFKNASSRSVSDFFSSIIMLTHDRRVHCPWCEYVFKPNKFVYQQCALALKVVKCTPLQHLLSGIYLFPPLPCDGMVSGLLASDVPTEILVFKMTLA